MHLVGFVMGRCEPFLRARSQAICCQGSAERRSMPLGLSGRGSRQCRGRSGQLCGLAELQVHAGHRLLRLSGRQAATLIRMPTRLAFSVPSGHCRFGSTWGPGAACPCAVLFRLCYLRRGCFCLELCRSGGEWQGIARGRWFVCALCIRLLIVDCVCLCGVQASGCSRTPWWLTAVGTSSVAFAPSSPRSSWLASALCLFAARR